MTTIPTIADARTAASDLDKQLHLAQLYTIQENCVKISFQQISQFSPQVYHNLIRYPLLYHNAIEHRCREVTDKNCQLIYTDTVYGANNMPPRNLQAQNITQLVTLQGVIVKQLPAQIAISELMVGSQDNTQNYKNVNNPLVSLDSFTNISQQKTFLNKQDEIIPGGSTFYPVEWFTIQDLPETLGQATLPANITCVASKCLVNKVKVGSRYEITGIYVTYPLSQYNVSIDQSRLSVYLLVCGIRQLDKIQMPILTTEEQVIHWLEKANQYNITLQLLTAAYNPSIYGHKLIKESLVLQLLQGPQVEGIRSTISILLVSNPGTGKSQMLSTTAKLSPISVMTTGTNASAAGLTAAVQIGQQGQQPVIIPGALPLANGGICCIDEFDKVNNNERSSLHEAMEQQTISISKAGITATIPCKCGILAAANYVYSSYDNTQSMQKNLNLPESLLSRFDLIWCVDDLKDVDKLVAEHVIENHTQAEAYDPTLGQQEIQENQKRDNEIYKDILFGDLPSQLFQVYDEQLHKPLLQGIKSSKINLVPQRSIITTSFLKQILNYCKTRNPEMTKEAQQAVSQYYSELRQLYKPISIVTARNLEGMIRLAGACSKLRVGDKCTIQKEDIYTAYQLLRISLKGQEVMDEYSDESDDIEITKSQKINKQKDKQKKVDKLYQLKQVLQSILSNTNDQIQLKQLYQIVKEKLDSDIEYNDFYTQLQQIGEEQEWIIDNGILYY